MAYGTEELLDEVWTKLQRHPRYDEALRLKGLNRGLVDLTLFASENYDVEYVLNPYDIADPTKFAMEFPLPQDSSGNCTALFVESVTFDSIPLKRITQGMLLKDGAEENPNKSQPRSYYIRKNKFINLKPRPSQQKIVQIYFLKRPDTLTNATDEVPELDQAYSDALISYACWWCTYGLATETQRSKEFLTLYAFQKAQAKFNLQQNADHRITRAR